MEESQEILLNSLRSLGVSIPESVSSFNDLTPTTLISICSQSLNLLGNNKGGDDNDMSFPNSVEDSVSMADKFKICSIISLTFKNLGYVGDMNYYKIQYEAENLLSQEKVLKEELGANTLQVQHLEEELGLWRAAADMAFDESHPMDFFLEQLNEQLDAKKHDIQELELQWDAFQEPIEEKIRSLEERLYAYNSEPREKLQKFREIELEMQFTLSEIRKREEEHLKLAADLKKRPKVASRRSYIERIKEITKNSGKLDTDIERILRETRELQLESNSIQESLHRTYAVVNETVLREAKKDTVGRQAYRLLTSIHERFEQISEKILATDRIRREMADREKKLATMASRSLNVDKQQADLDAILKENEYLEQQLQDN